MVIRPVVHIRDHFNESVTDHTSMVGFLVDEIDKILSPTKIQRLYNVVDLLHKILD